MPYQYKYIQDENFLTLSGGTTYIYAIIAGAQEFWKVHPPRNISGISSGILSGAIAGVKGIDKAVTIINDIFPSDVFRFQPYDENGDFTIGAWMNIIRDKPPVEQDIIKIVKTIITEQEYIDYLKNPYSPIVWTTLDDVVHAKRVRVCLKNPNYTYETFLKIIEAGVAAPALVKPIPIDLGFGQGTKLYAEGGAYDHLDGHLFIKDLRPKNVCAVFSRPKNWELLPMEKTGFFPLLFAMIKKDLREKSYNDEYRLIEECDAHIGKQPMIAYTERFQINPYVFDKKLMDKSVLSTRTSAKGAIII